MARQATRRSFLKFGLAASAIGIGAVGGLAVGPEYILYQQRRLFSILDLDQRLEVQPLDHRTHDGLTLRSWYNAPSSGKPTIVYFPGRDGNLTGKPRHLLALAEEGYGLVLAGYRGYGGNPGRPSERAMFLDAAALVETITSEGLAPEGHVLYGYSMGTAIAASAAAQTRPRGLVLEAPISTFGDAVRQQFAYYPRWLIRTHFDNLARVAELDVPVLMLAGGEDTVTPPAFALTLAAMREEAVTLRIFEKANHFNIMRLGGRDALRQFLLELEGGDNASEIT